MVPAPRSLKAFPSAERVKPKSNRRLWLDARTGFVYEWDYQHGRVERYDGRGVVEANMAYEFEDKAQFEEDGLARSV